MEVERHGPEADLEIGIVNIRITFDERRNL
jgi:hypothetical protein